MAARFSVVFALLCLPFAARSFAQNDKSAQAQKLLPAGAKIIETADITALAGKPRLLVLWMLRPTRQVIPKESEYCGSWVHGDHWQGPSRLSLIDTTRDQLINTIRITDAGFSGKPEDRMAIPFLVFDEYWRVPKVDSEKRGEPQILFLRDLTGDGVAAEFAMFIYSACGIAETSVLGYSPKLDRATRYPVVVHENGKAETKFWVSQIFARKPVSPGHWLFKWTPAHGTEEWFLEDVSFDERQQAFVNRRKLTDPPKP